MNMKKLSGWAGLAGLIILSLVIFSASQQEPVGQTAYDYLSPLDNCTVIMVGKNASVDGSTMTTHTADCGMCDWTWRYVPPADHKPGEMSKLYRI